MIGAIVFSDALGSPAIEQIGGDILLQMRRQKVEFGKRAAVSSRHQKTAEGEIERGDQAGIIQHRRVLRPHRIHLQVAHQSSVPRPMEERMSAV